MLQSSVLHCRCTPEQGKSPELLQFLSLPCTMGSFI
uniref:Uncharacterized protein n=1 Tax=Anguilla anguilla TaxID=7936 RepID=A0A0E9PR26_ANGAN